MHIVVAANRLQSPQGDHLGRPRSIPGLSGSTDWQALADELRPAHGRPSNPRGDVHDSFP